MAIRTGADVTNEAVKTLVKFQSGDIQPISTGSEHLDDALLGGFLPGTVLGIVARSGHGKTHTLESIQRHIMTNDNETILLQCAWELEVLKLLTRDIAFRTNQSTRDVMFKEPEGDNLDKFKDICDSFRNPNMFFQNEPVSSKEFEEDIMELISQNPDKKILVSIDNLENALNTEGSQKASMDKLLYTINILKKRHPFICFVILNQANNELTKRAGDLKAHKPMESDIYGTDQLLKLCDVLVFKVMPTKLGIYDKFMVFGKDRYDWLNEFKLPSSSSTTSFDPFGCVFYFYLKIRQVEDEKNIKDVHISRMYTREDCGVDPVSTSSKPKFSTSSNPKFSEPEELVVGIEDYAKFPLNNSSAKGESFNNAPF